MKTVNSKVHVFSVLGTDLAYDPTTGSLHKLDPVGKAVIEHIQSCTAPSFETALNSLSDTYSPREIEEAWNEACKMSGKSLWVRDANLSQSYDCEAYATVPVKALCLDVAHDCNLACKYCFAAQGRFGGRPELMTKETARAAIDFIIAASRQRQFLDVDFFGGEPLMAFDVVKDTVKYAKEQGKRHGKVFRFTLTTNCTLLTNEIAEYLARENISLILSIDGRPEVHDRMRVFRGGQPSHSLAIEGAKKAVRARKRNDYWVRGTFTKYNLDFDNDVRYLYEQGFRYISLEPAVGEGDWSIDESHLDTISKTYANLARFWAECFRKNDPFYFYHFYLGLQKGMCLERRQTGCGAGYEYVTVTPSGEIYACHQLVGKKQYLLGNVFDGITNRLIPKLFYSARVPNKPTCIGCWARYLCGGGCHARALASTGEITEPDPMTCLFVKNRMEYALYVEFVRATEEMESSRV